MFQVPIFSAKETRESKKERIITINNSNIVQELLKAPDEKAVKPREKSHIKTGLV